MVWGFVLGAMLAARQGLQERAHELIEEVDRETATLRGGMQVDLLIQEAEVTELLGRPDDAAARLRRAADLADRLGYLVGMDAATARLAALEPAG